MSYYSKNRYFKETIKKKMKDIGITELQPENDMKKIYYCDINYGKRNHPDFKKCMIINQLENVDNLRNKRDQYLNFIKFYGKKKRYIPFTIAFNKKEIDRLMITMNKNKDKRWIVKPENGTFRRGITVLNNWLELKEYVSKYNLNNWIIQEYIEDPLLLNKKKFHFRVYALYINNKVSTSIYILNYGFMYTANKEYQIEPIDLDRLLSGESSKNNVFMFPNDIISLIGIQNWRKIVKPQFIKIIKETILSTIDTLKCPNSNNLDYKCFKFFGYDILIDNKLNCYLAEINARDITFKYPSKKFIKTFYDDMLKLVLLNKSLSNKELKSMNLPFERLIYKNDSNLIEEFKENSNPHKLLFNDSRRNIYFIIVILLLIFFIIIINK